VLDDKASRSRSRKPREYAIRLAPPVVGVDDAGVIFIQPAGVTYRDRSIALPLLSASSFLFIEYSPSWRLRLTASLCKYSSYMSSALNPTHCAMLIQKKSRSMTPPCVLQVVDGEAFPFASFGAPVFPERTIAELLEFVARSHDGVVEPPAGGHRIEMPTQ